MTAAGTMIGCLFHAHGQFNGIICMVKWYSGGAFMQKAIIVQYYNDKKNNLSDLNQLLQEGWKVVSQSAMSGGEMGATVYSLVILEKN